MFSSLLAFVHVYTQPVVSLFCGFLCIRKQKVFFLLTFLKNFTLDFCRAVGLWSFA